MTSSFSSKPMSPEFIRQTQDQIAQSSFVFCILGKELPDDHASVAVSQHGSPDAIVNALVASFLHGDQADQTLLLTVARTIVALAQSTERSRPSEAHLLSKLFSDSLLLSISQKDAPDASR